MNQTQTAHHAGVNLGANVCAACGKKFGANVAVASTLDGQLVFVAQNCKRKIAASGDEGFQSNDGHRLFLTSVIRAWGNG